MTARLSPCAACTHAEDHHLGCRLHDGCCGADDCGCMGYDPTPATRGEIERTTAFAGLDPDELETFVRLLEANASSRT